MVSREKSICVGPYAEKFEVCLKNYLWVEKEQERESSLISLPLTQICKAPLFTESTNMKQALSQYPWTFMPQRSPLLDSHLPLPAHRALDHALPRQFQKHALVAKHLSVGSKNAPGHGDVFEFLPLVLGFSEVFGLCPLN